MSLGASDNSSTTQLSSLSDEIAALKDSGIEGVKVDVPGEETERLRAKWVHNLANDLQSEGVEIPERMAKYLKDHPYMEPDGLQAENNTN